MDLNRNQIFMLSLVVLLFGLQLRFVESYVLNEKASRFIAERMQAASGTSGGGPQFFAAAGPTPRRTIHPPDWLGWALISFGAVGSFYALSLNRPVG